MKTLTVAAIAIMTAALTVPAYSQSSPGRSLQRREEPTVNPEKKKAEEKTYNDAVSRIPPAKQEYDPWAGVRPKTDTPPAKPRR
jgi:hypothetical protein